MALDERFRYGGNDDFVDNLVDYGTGVADLKESYLDQILADKKANLGISDVKYDTFLDQGKSGSDGYSVINGHEVRNSNKFFNNLSMNQIDTIEEQVKAQKGLNRDEQGRLYKDGLYGKQFIEDQDIQVSSQYQGDTQGGAYGTKVGLGQYGVKPRYIPGLAEEEGYRQPGERPYGWKPGDAGIDAKNAKDNWYIGDTASRMEMLKHGNRGYIDSREMFDDGSKMSALDRALLGDGASEYYNKGKLEAVRAGGQDATPEEYDAALKYALGGGKSTKDIAGVYSAGKTRHSMEGLSTSDRMAIQEEQRYADSMGWAGKNLSDMNESETEDYLQMKDADQLQQGYYSDDGFLASTGKKMGKYALQATGSMSDTVAEGFANTAEWLYEVTGNKLSPSELKHLQKVKDFWNKPQDLSFIPGLDGVTMDLSDEVLNRALGIDTVASQKAHEEMSAKWDEGDYTGVIGAAVDNFGTLLSDSIPEMMMLSNPMLFSTAINKRTQDQKNAFTKANHGVEPTNMELAMMAGTNALVLGFERLALLPSASGLLTGPLKTMYAKAGAPAVSAVLKVVPSGAKKILADSGVFVADAAKKVGDNALTRALKKTGQVVGDTAYKYRPKASGFVSGTAAMALGTAAKVGRGAAFEAVQEPVDQANENFWKKGGAGKETGTKAVKKAWKMLEDGKIISKKDAGIAAISGGVLGVIMGAPGNLMSVPELHAKVKREIDDGVRTKNFEHMTESEREVSVQTVEKAVEYDLDEERRMNNLADNIDDADLRTIIGSENTQISSIVESVVNDDEEGYISDPETLEEVLTREALDESTGEGDTGLEHTVLDDMVSAHDESMSNEQVEEILEVAGIEYNKDDDGRLSATLEYKDNETGEEYSSEADKPMLIKRAFELMVETDKGREMLASLVPKSLFEKIQSKFIRNNEKEVKDKVKKQVKDLAELKTLQRKAREKDLARIKRIKRITQKKGDEVVTKRTNKRVPDIDKMDVVPFEDKSLKGKIGEVLMGLLSKNNSVTKVIKHLSKYTDEAIQEAMDREDEGSTLYNAARKVLELRENARGNMELEGNTATKKDYELSKVESRKVRNFAKVKRLAAKKKMTKAEFGKVVSAINVLKRNGHLNKEQAKSLLTMAKNNIVSSVDDDTSAEAVDESTFFEDSVALRKRVKKLEKKIEKIDPDIEEAILAEDKDAAFELNQKKINLVREKRDIESIVREQEKLEKEEGSFKEVSEEDVQKEVDDDETEKEDALDDAKEQAKKDSNPDYYGDDYEYPTADIQEAINDGEEFDLSGYTVKMADQGVEISKDGKPLDIIGSSDAREVVESIVEMLKEEANTETESTEEADEYQEMLDAIQDAIDNEQDFDFEGYDFKVKDGSATLSKDGKVVTEFSGAVTSEQLIETIDKLENSSEDTEEKSIDELTQEERDELIKQEDERMAQQQYNRDIETVDEEELDEDEVEEVSQDDINNLFCN